MLYQNLGKRMSTRRKSLNMTQAQLAEQLGLSNNHISGIETGSQVPSLETFVGICNALHVTPDYLLLGSMHSDNITQNLIETLHLCDPEALEELQVMANFLAEKITRHYNNHPIE